MPIDFHSKQRKNIFMNEFSQNISFDKPSGTFKLPRNFRKTERARRSPNLFITLMRKVNSGNEHGSRENPRSTKTESSMSSLRECRSTRVCQNKRNIVISCLLVSNVNKTTVACM